MDREGESQLIAEDELRTRRWTYKLGKVELPGEVRKIFGNESRENEHVVGLLEGEAPLPPLRSQLVGRLEGDADVRSAIPRLCGNADPVLGKPSVDEGDGSRGKLKGFDARDDGVGLRVDRDDGDLLGMGRAEAPVVGGGVLEAVKSVL